MAEDLDVVIVGAGQHGLGASWHLSRAGVRHRVFEAGGIGASWRRLWDSFRTNTPRGFNRLPGFRYDGPDPHGFSTKEEVVGFLEEYVRRFDLPVECHQPVLRVTGTPGRFRVETPRGETAARALIVATGPAGEPCVPPVLRNADAPGVRVMHLVEYRSPRALPPGAVLVVGGGQSGAQIAEDLREGGREVWLSLTDRPSNVRRLRGKDFMELWEVGGILHQRLEEHPDYRAGGPEAKQVLRQLDFPLVSGTGGGGLGHSITLRSLAQQGIRILGRLRGVEGGIARFDDARPDVAAANAASREIRRELERIAETCFAPGELEPAQVHDEPEWMPERVVREIDLEAAGITTIIACTGFRHAWPWLELPRVVDSMGYPLGDRGVSPFPGLYFLGLFFLHRLSTTCLCNGGQDAGEVVDHLRRYLAATERYFHTDAEAHVQHDTGRHELVAG